MAAAFDYFGPIVSLLHRFKYSGEFAIAKTFASFLILQLSKLRWERPDVIVPVPQTLSHLFLRGYNPPALIAYEMGKILGCQVLSPLRKKEDRLPQTFLDRKDRITLSEENFSWTKRCDLRDKVVLIVDDVMTTGATIRSVSVILKEECPLRIYGLAVCNNDTHYS
jgi:ComF family protein